MRYSRGVVLLEHFRGCFDFRVANFNSQERSFVIFISFRPVVDFNSIKGHFEGSYKSLTGLLVMCPTDNLRLGINFLTKTIHFHSENFHTHIVVVVVA